MLRLLPRWDSTRPINVGAGLDPTQGARIVLSREPTHI